LYTNEFGDIPGYKNNCPAIFRSYSTLPDNNLIQRYKVQNYNASNYYVSRSHISDRHDGPYLYYMLPLGGSIIKDRFHAPLGDASKVRPIRV